MNVRRKNCVKASGCLSELYIPVRLTSRCVWGGGVWARTARPPGRRWCEPGPAAAGQRCWCAWRWTRSWPWGRPCSAAPPYAGRPASGAPAAYVRLGLKLQGTARIQQATWTSKIKSISQASAANHYRKRDFCILTQKKKKTEIYTIFKFHHSHRWFCRHEDEDQLTCFPSLAWWGSC